MKERSCVLFSKGILSSVLCQLDVSYKWTINLSPGLFLFEVSLTSFLELLVIDIPHFSLCLLHLSLQVAGGLRVLLWLYKSPGAMGQAAQSSRSPPACHTHALNERISARREHRVAQGRLVRGLSITHTHTHTNGMGTIMSPSAKWGLWRLELGGHTGFDWEWMVCADCNGDVHQRLQVHAVAYFNSRNNWYQPIAWHYISPDNLCCYVKSFCKD